MQLAPDEEPKKQDQPHPEHQDQPPKKDIDTSLLDSIMAAAPQPQGEEPKKQELSPKPSLPLLKQGYIRQIIDFSPSSYKVLEELAGGSSIGEALHDAIALSKWFNDTIRAGDKIYVKWKGKLHEVVKI